MLYKQSPHIHIFFFSRRAQGAVSGSNVCLEKNIANVCIARAIVVADDIEPVDEHTLKVFDSGNIRLGVLGHDATNGKFGIVTFVSI